MAFACVPEKGGIEGAGGCDADTGSDSAAAAAAVAAAVAGVALSSHDAIADAATGGGHPSGGDVQYSFRRSSACFVAMECVCRAL